MNLKDIYIQFAKELQKTELLDEFDTATGLAVMKIPITQRQACSAVKAACEWLLRKDELITPFLKAAGVHKTLDSDPFDVHVRCMTPLENEYGCTFVDVNIPETATRGTINVVLYSHTVIDVFLVVEELLRLINPALVESILYNID